MMCIPSLILLSLPTLENRAYFAHFKGDLEPAVAVFFLGLEMNFAFIHLTIYARNNGI